ncbi:uncharacterized protein HaLaN_08350 [Haematococcus lacustris]|uniref:Cytochrome P450 n=1 Tax=Haematococcus lacustris TaxID=44745 RepID=A0A699YS19_HAELA|nr:uncharacterized protein HaLaN_08350 [Haematococcus lacustris]
MNHLMLAASFKPERWMEGGSKPRYLHAFSYGPHSCLGKDLALMELKITLVHMARAGTWQLADCKNPCIIFVPTVKLTSGPAKLQLNPLPL